MTSFRQTAKKGTRNKSILLSTLLLLFFTVTIQQCSSPEEINKIPEEKGKQDPPNEEKPGDTGSEENNKVDKSGGKIFKDKITIVVPADAFTTSVTMEITTQASGVVMGEFEASPYYKIKLPRNFSKPLKMELPANAEITQGDVYFRFSAPGVEISSQQESASTLWIKGVKEGDSYTATLEPFEEISTDAGELIVGLVKDYQTSDDSESRAITAEQKCVVFAPRYYHEESRDIALHVEEAIKRLEAIGFSFSKRNKQIQVEVKQLNGADAYGYFIPSRYSSDWNSLVINSQKLSEKEEIKRTVMHEMTHFVQYYYDPRWVVTKSFMGGDFLWMDEAVAVWAESLYVEGISSVQYGNQFCPLEGFSPLEGEDKGSHGYGMAGLVRWMANRYGNDKIVNLHKQQEAGATSVYDAFDDAFPDLFIEYGIFLKDYIRANGVKELLQGIGRSKMFINSMNEVKSNEPIGIKPHSTFIERISIDPDYKLPDKVTLSIKVEGGMDGGKGQICELYRYDNEKKEIIFVDEFFDSYQYEEVAALQEKKDMLFVVYYHPFNKESDVTMTVRLEEKLEFAIGKIKLTIDELNNYSGFYSATFADELVVPFEEMKGTSRYVKDKVIFTSSSTYTNTWSNIFDNGDCSWEITLEMDAKSLKIIKGTASNVSNIYNRSGALTKKQSYTLSFKDVPYIKTYTDGNNRSYRFGASQSDGSIENFITAFGNTLEEMTWDGWKKKEVSSWKPNTKWSISVILDTR
ncbi:MAG: hypothetical protein A2W86_11420 [Bacteroidetes bacterium GWD2_45_23]|nr:MAG: hypothetical protein A2W87_08595 [Bacteroidetes bacterium GWC2_46_850]OFX71272.1 MAG: hypothetical protein A2071_05625 [Bacteroidetes bacterium GWC1_47_7]OFX85437.1 MAG: hypothetical protein A2W86_11420 [Bacteroidetes bacterium GWD2_45_23]HAR37990.1 hypothetical protein [Porphyromonadaceae bacterium]HBB00653.1 hypothetical protein [Porphyromonadaceae bacterium]